MEKNFDYCSLNRIFVPMNRLAILTFTLLTAILAVAQTNTKTEEQNSSEWTTIQNGILWKTPKGETVQAHAPGFVRMGNRWYMVGEDRSQTWNPDVNLYSSTDLHTWRFEKKIIENGKTDSRLGSIRMIERAKLLYNEKTKKFVVWCHWESRDYSASEAACFVSDKVDGDYRLVWSGRPLGIKSRDCNVFKDQDGKAYFISTTEENQHLGLFELSEDYLSVVNHTQLFPWQRREAPAIVRINNRYFMLSSACTGWDPNQCKLAYSDDLRSGWSELKNIGNQIAYDTQAAAILEVKGTKQTTYLYVGDRWQDPNLPNTKTIMFPITFSDTSCDFVYHERFDLNFATGEWRETPMNGYFADKKNWKVINQNEKEMTIDMGETLSIQGFLSTPRLESRDRELLRSYRFEISMDGESWTMVSRSRWLPYYTVVRFEPNQCRYIRLTSNKGQLHSVAALDVVL